MRDTFHRRRLTFFFSGSFFFPVSPFVVSWLVVRQQVSFYGVLRISGVLPYEIACTPQSLLLDPVERVRYFFRPDHSFFFFSLFPLTCEHLGTFGSLPSRVPFFYVRLVFSGTGLHHQPINPPGRSSFSFDFFFPTGVFGTLYSPHTLTFTPPMPLAPFFICVLIFPRWGIEPLVPLVKYLFVGSCDRKSFQAALLFLHFPLGPFSVC